MSDKNKIDQLDTCCENLANNSEGKWRLCDDISGDEKWFYLRHIGHKSSNCSWAITLGSLVIKHVFKHVFHLLQNNMYGTY